jgi:AAA+ ATPase superfamily predicted ATPase
MASIIGRQDELKRLDEVYEGNIRNVYINARPRIGASALVKRFCEKSKFIYTTFYDSTPAEAVKSFRLAIEEFQNEPVGMDNPGFPELFHVLSRLAKEYDPIIVFDRTQYAPEEFVKQLKWFTEGLDCMTILIGFNDSARFDITFSDIIDLEALPRAECNRFHPKMTAVDRLKTYMTVGGVPLYHSMMNKGDYAESIEKGFLGSYPKLVAECELMLRQSAVPYPMCCAILSDIANFKGRPIDIAVNQGISRQLCDIYLKKLVEEDLICTIYPIGNSPRKPVYIVKNPLLSFYFIVIRMNPEVQAGKANYKDIERYADMFLEIRFRDICTEYIRNHYDVVSIGRWWSKDEDTQKPTLCAIINVYGEQKTLIADCKFRGGKLDQGALKAFVARAEMIQDVPEKKLIMFSVSGFEDKLLKKAKAESITLVGPNEIL